jgi:hypothetical protein
MSETLSNLHACQEIAMSDQSFAQPHTEVTNSARSLLQKVLLSCGIGYGAAYIIANDGIAAVMFDGYSRLDQAISELSGTQAPSRTFLAAMIPAFTLLVIGFGIGVWRAAGPSRALRTTGAALVAHGLIFPLWLLFPMTSRDQLAAGGGGINDIGHMVLSVLSLVLILTQMGTSAAGFGTRFRYFSIVMAITLLAAGGDTASTASATAAGDATPWMGLIERVMYGSWLLWMAALAVLLLRRRGDEPQAGGAHR